MDPVALIVMALAAGAGSAVQDETSDAVKGAYSRLRDAVGHRLAGYSDGELALVRHEADPRAGREPLARELTRARAGEDADLVARALALMKLIDRAGKYAAFVSGSQGAQVGDQNMQVNYFIQEPVNRRVWSPDGKPAGRLLAEVTDPFALEVHRPVQADDLRPGLPPLPVYVPREHDRHLAEVVRAAVDGGSGIAVLVGGSSTGKTRACWEALGPLRGRPKGWRLWHPIDPTRPEAALRELPSIGPRTVIWLNEAQFYLDAVGGLGERVAGGLRELLRDPDRAPVLVMATLWPQFWDKLTARPPAHTDDPRAQARELLAGRDITVPTAFTAAQLPLLAATGDPRLALAAQAAEGGRVVEFLAGAPELTARYRNAPPPAAALIAAAMDARRLGMGITLPLAFLEEAAPGYLDDTDWDALPADWLEHALAYTAAPCKGTRGPLTRIRPRSTDDPAPVPAYRLADYLEQHGRNVRRSHIPPASFWTAARFASPADLPALATAADGRGLLRDAARLRKRATRLGDITQAAALIRSCRSPRHHSSVKPAQWAAGYVSLDDPAGVAQLLSVLREAGAGEQAATLARRAATHAPLNDPSGVAELVQALRRAGAREQAATLARRAATHAPLDSPYGIAKLLDSLREAGAGEQAAALARRAASHVPLDDPAGVALVLYALRRAGAGEQTAALLARDPATHASLDDPVGVAVVLGALWRAGAGEQAAALLARDPATHVPLDDLVTVAWLLDALRGAGAGEQAAALARRAATHAPLHDPAGVTDMLDSLREAGAGEQAAALARRAAACFPLHDPSGVAKLLDSLREAGAGEQAAALARRAASHVPLDDPAGVALVLYALRRAGAGEQAAALLARDPATHALLDSPHGVAQLLDSLREAGAGEQAAALARRAATHAPLDSPYGIAQLLAALRRAGAGEQAAALLARDPATHALLDSPHGVAQLLDSLREAGAEVQVVTLVDRLPPEGHFDLFRRQSGRQMPYLFGREPDGSPAPPWGWSDLD